MKIKSKNVKTGLAFIGATIVASACSSMPGQAESGKEIVSTGPTVMNTHVEPGTIDLNRDLQPTRTPEVLADVKDFRSKITGVKLKFLHVPLEVPMENIGGTTWRAELSPQQLQMLAVSGKTIKYDATVVATDSQGHTGESQSTVTVAVKSPDLSTNATS